MRYDSCKLCGGIEYAHFLDIGCTVSIMPKAIMYGMKISTNEILFPDYMVMHTGNGDINAHFWLEIQYNAMARFQY